MKRLIAILALFALPALARLPDQEWTVDSQNPQTIWNARTFAGGAPLFRIDTMQRQKAWTNDGSYVGGFLWYGTNADWRALDTKKVPVTILSNAAACDVYATTNSFPAAGSYYAGLVYTNATGSLVQEWGRGDLTVLASGGISAVGALTFDPFLSVAGGLLTYSNRVVGLTSQAVVNAVGAIASPYYGVTPGSNDASGYGSIGSNGTVTVLHFRDWNSITNRCVTGISVSEGPNTGGSVMDGVAYVEVRTNWPYVSPGQTVSNSLLFAGHPWSDVPTNSGGGGSPTNWSAYPAIGAVNVGGNPVTNLSYVGKQFGPRVDFSEGYIYGIAGISLDFFGRDLYGPWTVGGDILIHDACSHANVLWTNTASLAQGVAATQALALAQSQAAGAAAGATALQPYGNGGGLTNITAAQVGAVPTNDARYLAALTNAAAFDAAGSASAITNGGFTGTLASGATVANGITKTGSTSTPLTNNAVNVTLAGVFTATGGNVLTNSGAFMSAFTNSTTGWFDGVLNGSNGVFVTRNGTNRWIVW